MGLTSMEKSLIDKKVNALLRQYGYKPRRERTIDDIVVFVKRFGFIVLNADLDESEDGFLLARPGEAPVIGVNSRRSLDRCRFIVAHEFAHYNLHYDGDVEHNKHYWHRENKKGKTEEEQDADYFAAALLMPEKRFKRDCKRLKRNKLDQMTVSLILSDEYQVPLESAYRRISEVGVVF